MKHGDALTPGLPRGGAGNELCPAPRLDVVRGEGNVVRRERGEDVQERVEAGRAGIPVPALPLGSRETLHSHLLPRPSSWW